MTEHCVMSHGVPGISGSTTKASSWPPCSRRCPVPPLQRWSAHVYPPFTRRGRVAIGLAFKMTGLTGDFGETISTDSSGIDELDEGCILAEKLNLSRINIFATWGLSDRAQHLSHVLPSLGLVNALKLNVDLGLRLHVRYIPRQWQTVVLLVELTHRVGDDPEARPLLDLYHPTLASLATHSM